MLANESPLTILPTIGTIIVNRHVKSDRIIISEIIAPIHSGRCFPFTEILASPFIIGLARSETITEVSIYANTLLKNQQSAAIMQKIAANRVYLARRSVYFSDSIV